MLYAAMHNNKSSMHTCSMHTCATTTTTPTPTDRAIAKDTNFDTLHFCMHNKTCSKQLIIKLIISLTNELLELYWDGQRRRESRSVVMHTCHVVCSV